MKRIFLSLLFLITAAPAVFSQDKTLLSNEEWTLADSCADNIGKKTYSPVKAAECLDKFNEKDYDLLNRLNQYSDTKVSYMMARLAALKDLGDFLNDAADKDLQHGLLVRLEASPCVVCSMGLGPQPDKFYPWVDTYYGNRLPMVKKASLDWATLNRFDRDFIKDVAQKTEADWAGMKISERREAFTVENTPALAASTASAANMARFADKYDSVGKKLQTAAGTQGGAGAFLGKAFDNADQAGGEVRAGWWPPGGSSGKSDNSEYKLTDEQAVKLAPRLVQSYVGPGGELSGTKVGDDLVAFSKTPGGEIKLSVANMAKNTNGDFTPGTGKIRISKQVVEKAMEKYKITPDQLMDEANKDALKKVGRYTAPIFVHEYGGHQVQKDWARKNGVLDMYYMDMETDAFSKQSLFVLQKQQAERKSGNAAYNSQVQEWDVMLARKLKKEGFTGMGREVLYYEVPSQSGRAAMNFERFESAKKELTARLAAAKADPAAEAARDAARPVWSRTAEWQKTYDNTYPWYKLTLKKTAEDNTYYQQELNILDKK